jgi:biotin carboxyl carrier protein
MKKYDLTINGNKYNVEMVDFAVRKAKVKVNGKVYEVGIAYDESDEPVIVPQIAKHAAPVMSSAPVQMQIAVQPASGGAVDGKAIQAPMPGLMLKILAKVGDPVSAGQKIAVMEAMKMENDINSTVSGTVKAVKVGEGENVQENQVLFVIG